jgi:hypothetical protein
MPKAKRAQLSGDRQTVRLVTKATSRIRAVIRALLERMLTASIPHRPAATRLPWPGAILAGLPFDQPGSGECDEARAVQRAGADHGAVDLPAEALGGFLRAYTSRLVR